MATVKKSSVEFLAGPFDGWKVREGPNFKKHYYVPIYENNLRFYHYYELEGSKYMYKGEVEMALSE